MLMIGERQVIWTVWLTYGAFYFCRTNLSVALPGIERELGYDKVQMGVVLLGLKIAYGMGQLVNGQLAERFSPRLMLAIGMFCSAGLNVAFGFGTALYFFLFVWATNGYCQSLGWTPCVRVIGNWVPIQRRGKAIGIVGTGYQLTAGLTFVVSGLGVWLFGWRGAVLVPPAILVIAALAMLVLLRESPEQMVTVTSDGRASTAAKTSDLWENFTITLANPALWILALALAMLNASRYGFLDWGVSHLVNLEQERYGPAAAGDLHRTYGATLDATVLKSAVQYAVLPLGGILGSFLAGWASDRIFGNRRAPVICGLLALLGCLTLMYDAVARVSFVGTLVLLLFIGFTIYGPQVLLVGTAPADLASRGTVAAAAGFVNCAGYFGAAVLGDLLTGYLAQHYGWQRAIFVWAGWAFLAAILVAFLWNRTGHLRPASRVAGSGLATEQSLT